MTSSFVDFPLFSLCSCVYNSSFGLKIYALQAEALLKLRRHQDADKVMSRCPKFDVDECTKFFGPIGNANLLVTQAQVDLVAGRLLFCFNL